MSSQKLFFKKIFLAALGLRCCVQAFSSCGERGLLFFEEHGLLIAVASLVVEHGLQACRLQQLWHVGFSSCGTRAQLLCGMWDLPRPGIKPVSCALAGGLPTTAPPGKSPKSYFILVQSSISQLNHDQSFGSRFSFLFQAIIPQNILW